jgi:hypothetical protein
VPEALSPQQLAKEADTTVAKVHGYVARRLLTAIPGTRTGAPIFFTRAEANVAKRATHLMNQQPGLKPRAAFAMARTRERLVMMSLLVEAGRQAELVRTLATRRDIVPNEYFHLVSGVFGATDIVLIFQFPDFEPLVTIVREISGLPGIIETSTCLTLTASDSHNVYDEIRDTDALCWILLWTNASSSQELCEEIEKDRRVLRAREILGNADVLIEAKADNERDVHDLVTNIIEKYTREPRDSDDQNRIRIRKSETLISIAKWRRTRARRSQRATDPRKA